MKVLPMMGVTSQRSAPTTIPQMPRWRVKRLTAFAWKQDASDRVPFVTRAGEMSEREMRERYPALDPTVEVVLIDGQPQLLFALTTYAETEADARRRATFRFERALITTKAIGGARRQLTVPWGDIGVERL